MLNHHSFPAMNRLQHGLSVVELMVGVAIGLAVVAGGAKMLADGLNGSRRVATETRIAQDLRAATDVIARDLRRAGYWGQAWKGVGASPTANNYQTISALPSGGMVSEITYRYSGDSNDDVNDSTERFAFGLSEGVLRMRIGDTTGVWQPLTDAGTMTVTRFEITPRTAEIRLGDMCRSAGSGACCRPHPADASNTLCKQAFFERRIDSNYSPAAGEAAAGLSVNAACPELVVRSFDITIVAQGLVPYNNVVREIRESVRIRNDAVSHVTCP